MRKRLLLRGGLLMKSPFFWVAIATIALGGSAFAQDEAIKMVPRTSELKSFPCARCHKGAQKASTRPGHNLGELKHMREAKNCSLCHRLENLSELVMLDGQPVSFNDSGKLCGQCHGIKFREWKRGMHGRQTGTWSGTKDRLLCTACHDAHSPKFKQMKAHEAPRFPKLGIAKPEEE